MHIREAVAVAVDALRANKVRAVLTSIGVIIGSASIVLVVTVALTSQRFVISQIEAMGSNLVWVEMIKTPEKAQPLSYEINTDDLAAARAQIPDALVVAGFNDLPMAVVVAGRTRPVRLIGVTDGYQKIRRLIILRGRYFDFADMEARSKVCLITKDLADRVFGVENPVGRQLRMGELTFTVVGVFRERAETFGLSELQKESVIIPFSLMKYYTGTDVLSTLQLQTGGAEKVAIVERQISRLLKSRHPREAEYNVQTLVAIFVDCKDHRLGAAHRIDRDCLHRIADQRHRHHEHHVGYGERAYPRDRHSQGHRRRATRDHVAIPDRGVSDQRRRSGNRHLDWNRHSGDCAAISAGKFAGADFTDERGSGVPGVVLDGTFLRMAAGKAGGSFGTDRITAL